MIIVGLCLVGFLIVVGIVDVVALSSVGEQMKENDERWSGL